MLNFRDDVTKNPDKYKVLVVTVKGSKLFDNFNEAKKVYPDLDINRNTKNFTWAMNGGFDNEKPIIRFEDWLTNEALSV